MADFAKLLQQTSLLQLFAAYGNNNGNNSNTNNNLNALQQQPSWSDVISSQENKKNASSVNGQQVNASDNNNQRLPSGFAGLLDASKMVTGPVTNPGPCSKPDAVSTGSAANTLIGQLSPPASVIAQGSSSNNANVNNSGAGTSIGVGLSSEREESKSVTSMLQASPVVNGNNNNNNLSSVFNALSQPTVNSWFAASNNPGQSPQKQEMPVNMADQLRAMNTYNLPGVGFPMNCGGIFGSAPVANGQPFLPVPTPGLFQQQQQQQPQQQQQQQPLIGNSSTNGLNHHQLSSSQQLAPPLPSLMSSIRPPSESLPGPRISNNNNTTTGQAPAVDSDQFYAQLIQDTLRHNMAVAAATLFSGARPSLENTPSSFWTALIAQEIQQQLQQQQNPPQQQQQQQIKSTEIAPSRTSEFEAVVSKQAPTKVSSCTSPGVSTSNKNDMAAMGSHERVHYWLYGQPLTSPLPQSLAGRETSPVVPLANNNNKQEVPDQPKVSQNNISSSSNHVLSLPPVAAGSIVNGQPAFCTKKQQAVQNSNLGSLTNLHAPFSTPLPNGNASSRPCSRTAQEIPCSVGAPEAKRPRTTTPGEDVEKRLNNNNNNNSEISNCSNFPQKERIKHYEDVIDYVIANTHLMSPPTFIETPCISPNGAADLTASSNSNIAGSLVSSSHGEAGVINALCSMGQLAQPTAAATTQPSSLSSASNSPMADANAATSNTSHVHSMPKKAWLQRMNGSASTSQLKTPTVKPANHQFSPTLSTASSKSPSASFNRGSNGMDLPSSIYLQPSPCMVAAPKMAKCRECRLAQTNKPQNEACRFENFRRLRRTSRDHILSEGFLTLEDVRAEDEAKWLPLANCNKPEDDNKSENRSRQTALGLLSPSLARYMIGQLSSEFLSICREEVSYVLSLRSNTRSLSWRRHENKIRDLCDVCMTTVFNLHWFCVKCGFVVCFECFKQRQKEIANGLAEAKRWLTCLSANRAKHESDKLLPAVVIPPQCMQQVVGLVERYTPTHPQPIDEGLLAAAAAAAAVDANLDGDGNMSMDICLKSPSKDKTSLSNIVSSPLDILAEIASNSLAQNSTASIPSKPFVYELIASQKIVRFLKPIAANDNSLWSLGQEFLKDGKPFIVSKITLKANWGPDYFISHFGDQKVSLVNCVVSSTVDNISHSTFWRGFRSSRSRLSDNKSPQSKMCLKLKDWPVDATFAELLPDHHHDLLEALPLAIYTSPGGPLNLPSYLPSAFAAPDLGPKMYAAYGTGGQADVGSTSLHLDIADAVNINMHTELLSDDGDAEKQAVRNYIEQSPFVAEEFKQRVRSGELPGALWHIFHARDADVIRSYLNAICISKEHRCVARDAAVRNSADPIHDQVWYLDDAMLAELKQQHNVVPFTIVQFAGDAIFLPAGSAHQVRNLHSCIKVAVDFVCPERVKECRKLTNEFRRLPDSHLNHEDKLQLKNLLFHAVKDVVAVAAASKCQQPVATPPSPVPASPSSSDQRSPNLVIEEECDIKQELLI